MRGTAGRHHYRWIRGARRDAESRTFVNVLDVATATVRLQKDVKIKGQLAYAS